MTSLSGSTEDLISANGLEQPIGPKCKFTRANGENCKMTKLCDDGFCMRHSTTKKRAVPESSAFGDKVKKFEINANEADIIRKLNMAADGSIGDMGVVFGQETGLRINAKRDSDGFCEKPKQPYGGEATINIIPREIKTKKEVVEADISGDIYKQVVKDFDPVEYGDVKPVLPKKKKVKREPMAAPVDDYPELQKILDSVGITELSPEIKNELEGTPGSFIPGIGASNEALYGQDDDDELSEEEIKKKLAHQKMIAAMAYMGYSEVILGGIEKSFPRYKGIKQYFKDDAYTKSIWADSFLDVCTDLGVDLSYIKSYHMLIMGQMTMFLTYNNKTGSALPN